MTADNYEPFDSAYARQTEQGRAEVTAERDELRRKLATLTNEIEDLKLREKWSAVQFVPCEQCGKVVGFYAPDKIDELTAQIAAKDAEIERLRKSLHEKECVCNTACSSNAHYQRVNDNLTTQLAEANRKLEAAEKEKKELRLIHDGVCGRDVEYRFPNHSLEYVVITHEIFQTNNLASTGWIVSKYKNGMVVERIRDDVGLIRLHGTRLDALRSAIAAGWLEVEG